MRQLPQNHNRELRNRAYKSGCSKIAQISSPITAKETATVPIHITEMTLIRAVLLKSKFRSSLTYCTMPNECTTTCKNMIRAEKARLSILLKRSIAGAKKNSRQYTNVLASRLKTNMVEQSFSSTSGERTSEVARPLSTKAVETVAEIINTATSPPSSTGDIRTLIMPSKVTTT